MNPFYPTEDKQLFKSVKFGNHPIAIGNNPTNNGKVVIPFTWVFLEFSGHVNGNKKSGDNHNNSRYAPTHAPTHVFY